MKIGVIAEEAGDVEVLLELTKKLVEENTFSFKRFVGHGCGKLRSKCTAWAENLLRRGCSHLVVLHDLDQNDEKALREYLTARVSGVGFSAYIVLIPVREIEAWLMTDAMALRDVFGMKKAPRLPSNPETVLHAKEKLRDLVWKSVRKHYVNTIHNGQIAARMRISNVKRCRSFRKYPEFVMAG